MRSPALQARECAAAKREFGRRQEPVREGRRSRRAYVHITGLPETSYERLVGRDTELERLDEAWADSKTNILSLVAEGGAGKSALVNEWLKRLQADNYRGAEFGARLVVLQPGHEGARDLGGRIPQLGAGQARRQARDDQRDRQGRSDRRGDDEAPRAARARRRRAVAARLDTQLGQLKDQGLRALLRRFAPTPPRAGHGLIVLTSRLAVTDIARWKDGAAPVDRRRAAVGRGRRGAAARQRRLGHRQASSKPPRDFGGHPLALGAARELPQGDAERRRAPARPYPRLLADAEIRATITRGA